MKSIPKILAVSSIFCLAFAASPAEACERRGQHRAGKGHGVIKRILRTAQLTPDQKKQLKAMRQEFKQGRKFQDKGQFRAKRRAMTESSDESRPWNDQERTRAPALRTLIVSHFHSRSSALLRLGSAVCT